MCVCVCVCVCVCASPDGCIVQCWPVGRLRDPPLHQRPKAPPSPPCDQPASVFPSPVAASQTQYEEAIIGIAKVLEAYDSDKVFMSLGFGCKPPGGTAIHCLPLSADGSGACMGIAGVLQAYRCSARLLFAGPSFSLLLAPSRAAPAFRAPRTAPPPLDLLTSHPSPSHPPPSASSSSSFPRHTLLTMVLSGPTFFSPLLNYAIKLTQASQQVNLNRNIKYNVLLILTDGMIHDLQVS